MKTSLYNENCGYVQSANALFHFMGQAKFLTDAIDRKGLVPRYCEENISYLDVNNSNGKVDKICVLQKCFCDIPLHKITEKFQCKIIEDEYKELSEIEKEEIQNYNTHTAFYGEYAIAFSKQWCERHNLQPVHYLNIDSDFTHEFTAFLKYALNSKDLSDELYEDILIRMSFVKPLKGEMVRQLKTGKKVHFTKIFHDEQEWRYVPYIQELHKMNLERVIVKSNIAELKNRINCNLENPRYKNIWLKFEYEDIKYLIVPNAAERIELINHIIQLPKEGFSDNSSIEMQKSILVSKILALDEIRGDW